MAFYIVYIREAHPSDGNRPTRVVKLADPKNLKERQKAARACADKMKLPIPMLIDGMDDGAARDYGGYPDRLYLVGKDGKVVYRGGPGPGGFRPDELEREIKILLGILKVRRMRV